MSWSQVATQIEQGRLVEEPWPHYRLENVFHPVIYRRMRRELPDPSKLPQLSRASPKRRMLWLVSNNEWPPVLGYWNDVRQRLCEPIGEAVQKLVGVTGTSYGMALVYDEPGYELRPHTDTSDRLITTLFYLPKHAGDQGYGTILLKSSKSDPTGYGTGKNLERVSMVPYLPNTGLIFQRTDWSFHEVLRTNVERWTLSFDVFR